MTKKQNITYIIVGVIAVIFYWLFFTGGPDTSISDEDAIAKEVLGDDVFKNEVAEPQLGLTENQKERMETERLVAEYDVEIEKGADLDLWYYKRGIANTKLKKYRTAIGDYTKAIHANPESGNIYYNRGLLYEQMLNLDKAIEDYTSAIGLKPDDPRIYNTRGLALTEQRKYQLALNDYNKALELNDTSANTYFNRGTLYERNDDFPKAHADYTKAIELHTEEEDKADAYYRRAIVFYATGDFKSALDDVDKAIDIDAKDVKAYQFRSKVYEKLGNVAAAAQDDATAQTLSLESLLPGAYE